MHHGGWDGWPRLHGGGELGFQRDVRVRKVERKRGGRKDKMSKQRARGRNVSGPFPRNDLTGGDGDSIHTH